MAGVPTGVPSTDPFFRFYSSAVQQSTTHPSDSVEPPWYSHDAHGSAEPAAFAQSLPPGLFQASASSFAEDPRFLGSAPIFAPFSGTPSFDSAESLDQLTGSTPSVSGGSSSILTTQVEFPPRTKTILDSHEFITNPPFKDHLSIKDNLSGTVVHVRIPSHRNEFLDRHLVSCMRVQLPDDSPFPDTTDPGDGKTIFDFLQQQLHLLRRFTLVFRVPIPIGYETLFTALSKQISSRLRCSLFVSKGTVQLVSLSPSLLSQASQVVAHRAAQIHSQTRCHVLVLHTPGMMEREYRLSHLPGNATDFKLSSKPIQSEIQEPVWASGSHIQSIISVMDVENPAHMAELISRSTNLLASWDHSVVSGSINRHEAVSPPNILDNYTFRANLRVRSLVFYFHNSKKDSGRRRQTVHASSYRGRPIFRAELLHLLGTRSLDYTITTLGKHGQPSREHVAETIGSFGMELPSLIHHSHYISIQDEGSELQNDKVFVAAEHTSVRTKDGSTTNTCILRRLTPNITIDIVYPDTSYALQIRLELTPKHYESNIKSMSSLVPYVWRFEQQLSQSLFQTVVHWDQSSIGRSQLELFNKSVSSAFEDFKSQLLPHLSTSDMIDHSDVVSFEDQEGIGTLIEDIHKRQKIFFHKTSGFFWIQNRHMWRFGYQRVWLFPADDLIVAAPYSLFPSLPEDSLAFGSLSALCADLAFSGTPSQLAQHISSSPSTFWKFCWSLGHRFGHHLRGTTANQAEVLTSFLTRSTNLLKRTRHAFHAPSARSSEGGAADHQHQVRSQRSSSSSRGSGQPRRKGRDRSSSGFRRFHHQQ